MAGPFSLSFQQNSWSAVEILHILLAQTNQAFVGTRLSNRTHVRHILKLSYRSSIFDAGTSLVLVTAQKHFWWKCEQPPTSPNWHLEKRYHQHDTKLPNLHQRTPSLYPYILLAGLIEGMVITTTNTAGFPQLGNTWTSRHKTDIIATTINKQAPIVLISERSPIGVATVHLVGLRQIGEPMTVRSLKCHIQTGYKFAKPTFTLNSSWPFSKRYGDPPTSLLFRKQPRRRWKFCFNSFNDVWCHMTKDYSA